MSSIQSVLKIQDLSKEQIFDIYERAVFFKKSLNEGKNLKSLIKFPLEKKHIVALLFFEASTRTQMSFQFSCAHLDLSVASIHSKKDSSISKGESYEESIANVSAMDPDLIVIRATGSLPQWDMEKINVPVISAGFGTDEHPTQALLDVFTILEKKGLKDLKGQKVLIVGDVLHSRVANSNCVLMKKLGADIAICCPEGMLPISAIWDDIKCFDSLEEGLKWADICMGLRVQLERHTSIALGVSRADYRNQFCLNDKKMKSFTKEGLILHPGPFVLELDFSESLLKDPRCCVRDQVKNGVYIRSALMSMILGATIK